MAINYYRLLGVPPDADQHRLRSAYRSLAKRFHPDTNHGCEASADLFRQINAAYQILADPKLRAEYDAEQLAKEQAAQAASKAHARGTNPEDPQQKFNRFVDSLLDALFGPTEQPAAKPEPGVRAAQKTKPQRTAKRPDFSFYYHLEKEKRSAPYEQGEDGVFRPQKRTKPAKPANNRRHFKPGPMGHFVLLMLWSLLK